MTFFPILLLVVVYTDPTYSKSVQYYVRSSVNTSDHCPGNHCLTLAQFAANSTSYLGNETNISLSFLPGNHSLNGELSLSRADNLSMTTDIGSYGTVFIECDSQLGRFNISGTTFVTIKDLHFVGCGGNRVSQVEQFIVEDTLFEGVEGRGTALLLNEVTAISIVRSSFISNTHGSMFRAQEIFTNNDILNYIYLHQDPSLSLGGALYTTFSNISILRSNFTGNTAEIGGAMFVHNCSLHIIESHYSYNRASYGGVVITSESTIIIDSSTLNENTAEIHGGVMITYRDRFSISGSNFTNNGAIVSGVMRTYYSSFTVTSSMFANNNAGKMVELCLRSGIPHLKLRTVLSLTIVQLTLVPSWPHSIPYLILQIAIILITLELCLLALCIQKNLH